MGTPDVAVLQEQLLERRQKLEAAIVDVEEPRQLVQLLEDVDAALERMRTGSYGLCKACHEPIETERLLSDPLIEYCLDHLTPSQQSALEEDLDMAAKIQSALLPRRNLDFEGWEVFHHYGPAGAVSGDYCDLLTDSETKELVFLVGDVSGKGVAASMLMAHLHAMFRSLIPTGLPLVKLVERANRLLCESTMAASYATLVCGRATKSGEVEISNAGHCPPLVIRGGERTTVEATGLPIGLFCAGEYSVKRLHLDPGDTLVLYTDGLTEARDPGAAEYGVARLSNLVEGRRGLSPEVLIDACLKDLAAFRAGTPMGDDLTIMVIRRTG